MLGLEQVFGNAEVVSFKRAFNGDAFKITPTSLFIVAYSNKPPTSIDKASSVLGMHTESGLLGAVDFTKNTTITTTVDNNIPPITTNPDIVQ